MKSLIVVLLATLSLAPAFAQHPPQEEVPAVRRGPGPGGPGFGRCQESLSQMTATVEQVVASVIAQSGPKSQADMDTIAAYQNELRECNQMRSEFVSECVRKNALALVQLAFTQSGLCEGTLTSDPYLNDRDNNAAPEYIRLSPGTKVVLLSSELVKTSGWGLINIRVLSGPHAGREGWISRGGDGSYRTNTLTCLPTSI